LRGGGYLEKLLLRGDKGRLRQCLTKLSTKAAMIDLAQNSQSWECWQCGSDLAQAIDGGWRWAPGLADVGTLQWRRVLINQNIASFQQRLQCRREVCKFVAHCRRT